MSKTDKDNRGPKGHRSESRKVGIRASKILIVDDEPLICEILSRWLDAEGYNCHWVRSAEDALEALKAGNFSLLLADIKMPGVSGLELLAAVRQRFADVAVVMVTGVGDRQTALRALELGAYGYVIKPLQENEVIINVINALERRRLILESSEYERRLEEKARKQTREIRASREEVVMRLMAAQEYRHDETGAHVRRIGLYSEIITQRMGHPTEVAEMARLAGPMHDVGKIGIPDSILQKPGPLTSEEWQTMRAHTTIGARILEGTSIPLLCLATDIALNHHEKWDGSGYPRGLQGEDIPEPARIVAVLDTYDALSHKRVYRPALPEDRVFAILADGKGSHFDPRIYEVFLQALEPLQALGAQFADDTPPAYQAQQKMEPNDGA